MLLLSADSLTKHFGPEPVLDGASLEIRRGERIALVGPNGAGKSTLFRIITSELEADSGDLQLHAGARLGMLEQHPEFPPGETVWEVAHQALEHLAALSREAEEVARQMASAGEEERVRLGKRFDHLQHELTRQDAFHLDHKIERVLTGLGFAEPSWRQPAEQLSGGQQSRLLLARLLLAQPDIMLLDEPSNHLDIETTEWLESFLVDSSEAILVVSHDRFFLDRVTTRTLELYHGTIDSYQGNFSAYWRQKQERLEVQRRTWVKQQEEIAKLEDFVRRNSYGQKHAQAEDRRKKLERIDPVDPPREIEAPPMGFPAASRTGDIVMRVEHLSKGFDHPLFTDLSFDILRGQKWGILGPNGSGKTTLLRCLLGEATPDEGRIVLGTGVKLGYFDQKLSCVDPDAQTMEAIRPDHKEFVEKQRRDMLARFGVTGDMAFQKVASLSGGERNRTALALVASLDANVLVLDEPTNHLDLWSRDALERSLRKFDGSVILVSHDRYFLNKVADRLLVFEPDRVRVIEGNYDTYLHLVKQGLAGAAKAPEASASKPEEKPAQREKPSRPRRRFAYRKAEEIEEEILQREARIEALYEQLSLPETQRDGDRVKECQEELSDHQEKLAQLYEHLEESLELN